jgi:hypothetical protein
MTWLGRDQPLRVADIGWLRIQPTRQNLCAELLGKTFTQVGAKSVAPELPWRSGPRAPLLGEHNAEVLLETCIRKAPAACHTEKADLGPPRPSKHGKPFALSGTRVVDLTWMLASVGAGRFFTALGAEVIKVEYLSRLDGMRTGMGNAPLGGRTERDTATDPLVVPAAKNVNRSGSFMEINAAKRGISLNLKHPRAKELLIELIRDADILIEGFSPGTMDQMGFDYDRLCENNPRIVYVQQSGMGQIGTYGRLRSFRPTAQAFSGLSDMSGLPDPYPPAGIGYSYPVFLSRLLRRLSDGAGDDRRAVQPEGDRQGLLDRFLAGRGWNLSHRCQHPGPHGKRPAMGATATALLTSKQHHTAPTARAVKTDGSPSPHSATTSGGR